MKNNNNLITQPIPKLIRIIAIPASIGFFFNTMYNVVDTFYAGLLSTTAVAALALSFPIFFVIIAMGSGISTGASALIANAFGAGDTDKAKHYATQAISFTIIVGIFLTLLGMAAAPSLFKLLGAADEYLNIALEYINIIFLGTILFLLTFVLNSTLTAQGDTKTFRNALIAGFFLNLIFDPWFMFGGLGLPAMGLAGVAWATVVIQLFTGSYIGYKAFKTGIMCKKCFKMLVPEMKYYKDIAAQGFPASLNMMTVAIGIFIITFFVSKFGQASVAAYGIATRIDQMALLPNIGLNIATLTLVGQNNGARLFHRCKETLNSALKYGFIISTFGMVLIFIFARGITSVFTDDTEVIRIGVTYLRISIFVYWAYAILFITTSALQGLKKPMFAVWIGLYRQLVAPAIIFYLLVFVFGWGLLGIWWGIFIVNWTAVVITYFYIKRVMRKLFVPGKEKLPN